MIIVLKDLIFYSLKNQPTILVDYFVFDQEGSSLMDFSLVASKPANFNQGDTRSTLFAKRLVGVEVDNVHCREIAVGPIISIHLLIDYEFILFKMSMRARF